MMVAHASGRLPVSTYIIGACGFIFEHATRPPSLTLTKLHISKDSLLGESAATRPGWPRPLGRPPRGLSERGSPARRA